MRSGVLWRVVLASLAKHSKSRQRRLFCAASFLVCWMMGAVGLPAASTLAFGSSAWRPLDDWDYDGKRILGHIGHNVYLWDARSGEMLRKFVGHKESIDSLHLLPDGEHVI